MELESVERIGRPSHSQKAVQREAVEEKERVSAGKLNNGLSRFHAIMRELERGVLIQELAATGYNQCEAARRLGIHRNTFLRRCRVCDLDVGQLKQNSHAVGVMVEQKMRRIA
jgi:DNA-binding NtrC family response regulator